MREPVAVRLEAPLEQPVRLVLLGRDQPDDVLVQPPGGDVGLDVGDEAVLVLPARQLTNVARNVGHRAPSELWQPSASDTAERSGRRPAPPPEGSRATS